ncbi:MAG: topoisomerase DNA-binding C4 zinc finger domain-containing protein, partial [Planctomycetota bacterium]|nr:topoisomerase DNA-binding C4 zinc finger domain-containing protein [Planctomycetota bacterium]
GGEVLAVSGRDGRRETDPPPLYSLATLLEDLTRVARYVKDEKLSRALLEKDKGKSGERGGIGTPATRDVIIRTLYQRGFIEDRKTGKAVWVAATARGEEFYDRLPDSARYPDLTAIWHERQRDIERGELGLGEFVEELMRHIEAECARVKESGLGLTAAPPGREGEIRPRVSARHHCPVCGRGLVRRRAGGKDFWGCSGYPACRSAWPDRNGRPGLRGRERNKD